MAQALKAQPDQAALLASAWLATPATFAEHLSGGRWRAGRWHRYVAGILADAAWTAQAGGRARILLSAPPRHGKSELVSHWLPAWTLALFGDWPVLLASYEADFAASWGRKVRDTINAHAGALRLKVRDDSAAAARWETTHGGSMMTAGVGGPFTGKGGRLLAVDDPIKNREQANSPAYLRMLWDWWREVASPRLDPGNLAVVAMARWGPDDLVGQLIAEEGVGGTKWQVINLPEVAEDGDPLGRAPGEPLWPERFSREETAARCKEAGGPQSPAWLGLHQQRPQGRGDALFRPAILQVARRQDLRLEPARYRCDRCRTEDPGPGVCPRCERRLSPRDYLTAWDLARKRDWLVGITLAIDETPARIVGFTRFNRVPWPEINRRISERYHAYPGRHIGDATGIGDPVLGFIDVPLEPVLFSPKSKTDMVMALQLALEAGDIIGPATGDGIEALWSELEAYRWDDEALTQDCVMTLAMLAHAMTHRGAGDYGISVGGPARDHRERSERR